MSRSVSVALRNHHSMTSLAQITYEAMTKRVATHLRQKLISVCWCSHAFYWSVIGVSMALGLLAFRAIISLNAASPQELSQLCQQGFSDALCYLKRNSGWHQHLHDSLWCCLCMWRHWISPFGCWHGAGFYLSLALCSRSRLSTVCSYQPHPYSGEQLRVEVGGVCFGGFIARASSDVSGIAQASAMVALFSPISRRCSALHGCCFHALYVV